MYQTSPGVDRAVDFARKRALMRSGPMTLADLALGLLAEEEGRPAVILEKMGLILGELRARLSDLPTVPAAPPLEVLFARTRDWSIHHRADPVLLTDAFFLTVLRDDAQLGNDLGLDLTRFEALLSPSSPAMASTHPGADFQPPAPADTIAAGRALDANFNRAREALRTVEDYCRFAIDDAFLTKRVKDLRHSVAAVSQRFPLGLLIRSRDTLGDVGTAIESSGEYHRGSSAGVAVVNLKRLQESLRSLEEFGKLVDPHLARELEQCRYESYTIERAIAVGDEARNRLALAQVYVLLTAADCVGSMEFTIAEAATAGASIFQLREKHLTDRELLARTRSVRQWTRQANALFIVNDRPDIAMLADADGVHLGQDDLSVKEARRILGPTGMIGVSTHTLEQVRAAVLDGADYIGIGPTFPSRTKSFPQFAGLDFIRSATAETALPAFALGGIDPQNVAQVRAAGGLRVAVAASVIRSDRPGEVVAQLLAGLGQPT